MRSLGISWERAKILRDWRRYVDEIARSTEKILGDDARIYVFGSAVRGRVHGDLRRRHPNSLEKVS